MRIVAAPIVVKDGHFARPEKPAAGATMRAGALAKVGQPLG